MTLAELIEKLSTVRVVIGGETFTAKVLSAEEQMVLERVFPMPEPPMIKDPERGSKAPKVPDEKDPEYVKALEEYSLNLMAARMAVGIGAEKLGFDVCDGADLLKEPLMLKAAVERVKKLPYAVLRKVSEQIRTGEGDALEEAEKN